MTPLEHESYHDIPESFYQALPRPSVNCGDGLSIRRRKMFPPWIVFPLRSILVKHYQFLLRLSLENTEASLSKAGVEFYLAYRAGDRWLSVCRSN